MKIVGVGFDETRKSCSKAYLLKQISRNYPKMILANEIVQDADVLLINLDVAHTGVMLDGMQPREGCYVIMVVHEFSRFSIPYLKLADHVIFLNDLQRQVCENLLDLQYSSSVLPYPADEVVPSTKDVGDCFVYLEGDSFSYDDSYYETRIQFGVQWHSNPSVEKYHFFFEAPTETAERFAAFKEKIEKSDSRFSVYNTYNLSVPEIHTILQNCLEGQLFRNEITIEQYSDFVEQRQLHVLHQPLEDSSILAAMFQAKLKTALSIEKTFYNFVNKKVSTWSDWDSKIEELLFKDRPLRLAEKQKIRESIVFDTLTDLNIVYGGPLSTDYVFSVCFRNQEEKIIRNLESIASQAGGLDFGVVLVSDVSTDNSIKVIVDFCQKNNIKACVVDNRERRLASRNFYNVAHLLTTNDESVIIEVDGDDFLAGDDVLQILDGYYQQGALKTNGSYKIYPEEQDFTKDSDNERNHTHFDVEHPWNLTKCTAWLHLRTCKRHILCKTEVDHFLERQSKEWLMDRHDSAVQPRLIELAGDKAVFVKEKLYMYDVSGDDHDHDTEALDEEELKIYKKTNLIYHSLSFVEN